MHLSESCPRFHKTPANRPPLHSQTEVIACHLLSAFSRQRRCLFLKIGVTWSAAQTLCVCVWWFFFFPFKAHLVLEAVWSLNACHRWASKCQKDKSSELVCAVSTQHLEDFFAKRATRRSASFWLYLQRETACHVAFISIGGSTVFSFDSSCHGGVCS